MAGSLHRPMRPVTASSPAVTFDCAEQEAVFNRAMRTASQGLAAPLLLSIASYYVAVVPLARGLRIAGARVVVNSVVGLLAAAYRWELRRAAAQYTHHAGSPPPLAVRPAAVAPFFGAIVAYLLLVPTLAVAVVVSQQLLWQVLDAGATLGVFSVGTSLYVLLTDRLTVDRE